MKQRFEVILAGSGGQGLVLSGILLGEAAILEGKNVVQTQSYGIASRGGFSQAEVIIDREEIIFQQVQSPDVVLVLTREAMEKYSLLAASVPVFYDTTLLDRQAGENFYGFPFTAMASELGHAGTANMIALGVISALTGLVKPENLAKAIDRRFSAEAARRNREALWLGVGMAGKERDNGGI